MWSARLFRGLFIDRLEPSQLERDGCVFQRAGIKTLSSTISAFTDDPADISSWLTEQGWDVLSVQEHERSGRNRLLRITLSDGSPCILKQGGVIENSEAWFYSSDFCLKAPGVAIKPLLVDRGLNLVLLQDMEFRDLEVLSQEDPAMTIAAMQRLSKSLARLHAYQAAMAPPARIPFPSLDPVAVLQWISSSAAAQELIRRVQTRPGLRRIVAEGKVLSQGPEGYIHADIKPDNIVLTRDDSVLLIDWELSGRGPVLWDIGALIGSLVYVWIRNLDYNSKTTYDDWIEFAKVPYQSIFDAVQDFLLEYRNESKRLGASLPVRESMVIATCSWLISRAWASASRMHRLSSLELMMLMIAEGLYGNSEELFGRFDAAEA